jgi:hypothetical protein
VKSRELRHMESIPAADSLFASVTDAFHQSGITAAIQVAESEPDLAPEMYKRFQLDLYWKLKNLPAVVAVSEAGIRYCFAAAEKTNDTERQTSFRGTAKVLAANLASFTWPGWNEPDITITQADLDCGLRAAELNVQLADSLNRPDKARASALWTLGAQQLAARDYPAAVAAFSSAERLAAGTGDVDLRLMLVGYNRLSELVSKPSETIRDAFIRTLRKLGERGTEEAVEYLNQLAVALKVFANAG